MASATLLACMILPYAWVIGYDELERILPTLAVMVSGMPAFVPSLLISDLLGQHFHESQWLTFLLIAIKLAFGIWGIQFGPKRTIAYLMPVMQASALGLLVFYQLCIF